MSEFSFYFRESVPMQRSLLLAFVLGCFLALASACGHGGGGGGDDSGDDAQGDDDQGDDDQGDDDTGDQPPVIVHTPLGDQAVGFGDYPIVATITDDGSVASATCYYRHNGVGDYAPLTMTASGDTYTATIPAQDVGLVEYYLSATDNDSLTATLPADAPTTVFSFKVLAAMEIASDDGVAEDATRRNSANSQILLDMTPVVYPVKMGKMRFFIYDDAESLGKNCRAVLYADPAGTGPSAANLLWTSEAFTIDAVGDFIEVDAGASGAEFTSGSFLVGIENLDEKGPWIGLDESSAYLGKSWYYDATAGEYVNLSATPFAFNLMIRAVVILPVD